MMAKNTVLRNKFEKMDNVQVKEWFVYYGSYGVLGEVKIGAGGVSPSTYERQKFRNAYLEAVGH